MSRSHNKKRNVGLIFEQLVQATSESLLQSNPKKANITLGIIRKHFRPGTALYREFRLFNALVRTRVSNSSLATRILAEARKASADFDSHELMKEKSTLIKDINYTLDEDNFYARRVDNYRDYATIQTLLSDWRASNSDISRVIKYEDEVCKKLLSENAIVPDVKDINFQKIQQDLEPDPLIVKIMVDKFNERYSGTLNDEQATLIKEYVFGSNTSNKFKSWINTLREETITELNQFMTESKNQVLEKKVDNIISKVKDIDTSHINDDVVSKMLTVSRLKHVLLENCSE